MKANVCFMIDWLTSMIRDILILCCQRWLQNIFQKYVCHFETLSLLYLEQDVSPEHFEESPIIFGDFIKIGATDSDKMYEDLVDMKKLYTVLSEVFPS